jgi:hypothetical protein
MPLTIRDEKMPAFAFLAFRSSTSFIHLDSRFRLEDGIRIYLRGATALLRNEARGLHQNLFGNIAYCSKFILPYLGYLLG